jgi:N-acetylneuraminic acid mutarotase
MLYQPWKRLGDFPFHREFIGNGFQVGESAYQFGYDQTNYSLILWEFRQDTETWTQKGPAPFSAPSSTFSTLTKGYVLDGKQLFQYDPTTNQWVQKASWILPFNYMDELSCFSTEQHLYICGGRRGYNYYNTFYQYDELTNTWTTRKNFPEQAIFNATAFSILEKGYIALGQIGYYEPNLSIYEYNPATNNWTIKTSFQGILINDQSGRQGGRVFVINEKAFLFGGTQILSPAPNNRKDFYEFNSTTNSLKRLPDLPFEINYFPSTFSINGKGYILGNNVSNEVWEFDPEKQAPWLK